jgi:hypothetical protein
MTFLLDGVVKSARWVNVVSDGFTLAYQFLWRREPLTRQQQILFATDSIRVLLDSVCAYLDIEALSRMLLKENHDVLGRMEELYKQRVYDLNHKGIIVPEAEDLWDRLHDQLTVNIEHYQEGYRTLTYLEMGAGVTDIGHYFASTESQNTRTTLVMNLWTRASRLLNLESRIDSDLRLRSNAILNKIYIISITVNRLAKYGFKTYQFVMANRPAIEGVVNQARRRAADSCTLL